MSKVQDYKKKPSMTMNMLMQKDKYFHHLTSYFKHKSLHLSPNSLQYSPDLLPKQNRFLDSRKI